MASALVSGPRAIPGSPWIPMPISISSSPISKFGRRVCGSEQAASATPMVKVRAFALRATRSTSSSGSIRSQAAPAALKMKTLPATPRRLSRRSRGAEATSSVVITVRTSMPSIAAISAAMSKFITSPA